MRGNEIQYSALTAAIDPGDGISDTTVSGTSELDGSASECTRVNECASERE